MKMKVSRPGIFTFLVNKIHTSYYPSVELSSVPEGYLCKWRLIEIQKACETDFSWHLNLLGINSELNKV